MNVLAYILDFLGRLKKLSGQCPSRNPSARCPVVDELEKLNIYSSMMRLKQRSIYLKRWALVIVGLDLICAILQAMNLMTLAGVDYELAKKMFIILVIRSGLMLGVCGLIIASLSTGNHTGRETHGQPNA